MGSSSLLDGAHYAVPRCIVEMNSFDMGYSDGQFTADRPEPAGDAGNTTHRAQRDPGCKAPAFESALSQCPVAQTSGTLCGSAVVTRARRNAADDTCTGTAAG